MLKLAQETSLAQQLIFSTTNALKEERETILMTRSNAANDLRGKIVELEKHDRSISNKLAVLSKFSEQFQQQRKELLSLKIQLEQDISTLMQVSALKTDNMASNSAEELREKKLELVDVTEKLSTIEEEDSQLATRIQRENESKEDNFLKLSKARADWNMLESNSAVEPLSPLAIQLKALVQEQRARIQRFAGLEKDLAGFFEHELDEIRQIKEGWLNALSTCSQV